MTLQPLQLPAQPVADEEAIRAFLADVLATDIHLAAITPDGPLSGRWFGDDVEAAVAWAVEKNAGGSNAHWTSNVCGAGVGAKAKKADITAARFLHVDVDRPKGGGAWSQAEALQRLDALPIKPSVVISSGNGVQAVWALDTRLEKWGPIEVLNRELARQLGGDNCHNVDRLLRLPGTVNFPNRAKVARGCVPVLASLSSADVGRGYALETLQAAFPSAAVVGFTAVVTPPVAVGVRGPVTLLTSSDLTKGNLVKLRVMLDIPNEFFRTPDRSSWAHGIACEMISEGYAEDQVIGILLNPANAGAAHVTDQSDPWRAAQRAWHSANRALPPGQSIFGQAARGGASAAQSARPFEELLAAAESIDKDDIHGITELAAEAAVLDSIRCEKVLKALKKQTGLGLGALRDISRSAAATGGPDHLEQAMMVIDDVGAGNLVFPGDSLWWWTDTGVWKKPHESELKKRIHYVARAAGVRVLAPNVSGVLEVLKAEIFTSDQRFDLGDPESVNCRNGQVELRSGLWVMVPHRREEFRTVQLPFEYDDAATAPEFGKFLAEVFRDDEDQAEKVEALLELMGFTLMTHARHEKFVVLVGSGANGKSVLLRVLSALCGDENIAAVQPCNFSRSFDRAHLHHKLANVISELKKGEVFADAELKAISSGEPATVDHKYGQPFVMHPFATCWFGTNFMPHIRDFSDALLRRAVVLSFNRTFAQHEQNPQLSDKLKVELPGILNLVLAAYARALRVGFTVPSSCTAAKKAWRLDADQAAQFVEEQCDRDAAAEISSRDAYFAYKVWADSQGLKNLLVQRGFRERLTGLGLGERRTADTRYVTGLRLKQSTRIGTGITQVGGK